MATKGEVNEIVKKIIDATFDAGYYQATIEKTAAKLTDSQLKEYASLINESINKRTDAREELMMLLFKSI